MEKNNKQYLSVTELAKALNISRQAVLKKIKNSQIKAEKIGQNYIILKKNLNGITHIDLTEEFKKELKTGVSKVVREYGEVLKKLAQE